MRRLPIRGCEEFNGSYLLRETGAETMIFYPSYYEAIKALPREEQADAYNAIMEYAFYGNDLTDQLTGGAKIVLLMAKPNIDASNKSIENGKKGGRPKAPFSKSKTPLFENETPPLNPPFSKSKTPLKTEEEEEVEEEAEPEEEVEPELEEETEPKTKEDTIIAAIVAEWNAIPDVIHVREVRKGSKRYKALKARLKEGANLSEAIQRVSASSFCRGGGSQGWKANFDWFVRPDTIGRILEGQYDDRGKSASPYMDAIKNRVDVVDGW